MTVIWTHRNSPGHPIRPQRGGRRLTCCGRQPGVGLLEAAVEADQLRGRGRFGSRGTWSALGPGSAWGRIRIAVATSPEAMAQVAATALRRWACTGESAATPFVVTNSDVGPVAAVPFTPNANSVHGGQQSSSCRVAHARVARSGSWRVAARWYPSRMRPGRAGRGGRRIARRSRCSTRRGRPPTARPTGVCNRQLAGPATVASGGTA